MSGWPHVALGEVCDVLDSRRRPITKSQRVSGDVPYYGASGVQDYVDGFIFDEPLVLLGEDGAKWGAGDQSAYRIAGRSWVNNHAHVLRPRRESLDDAWLTYFLNASDLSEFITGVTVPKLNQEKMKGIRIPLPPLDEQKRIVAKLDEFKAKLDRKLEIARKRRDLSVPLLRLAQAASFKDVDTFAALGDVCEVLDRFRVPITKRDRKPGGVPYYGATGIQDYVLDSIFDEPLVLLGEDGAKWGAFERSAFCIAGPSWVNNHAHVLRPNRGVLLDRWLSEWLCASDLSEYITGVTVPKLNQERMKTIPVPIVAIDEQRRRLADLEAVRTEADRLNVTNGSLATACEQLWTSWSQEVLRGAAA